MRAIRNYTGPGAGMPIKLNSKGDVDAPMDVLNYRGNVLRSLPEDAGPSEDVFVVGHWDAEEGYRSREDIVWPGHVKPDMATRVINIQTFLPFGANFSSLGGGKVRVSGSCHVSRHEFI